MKQLLSVRRFSHDPQSVLAAVHRLALVGVELVADTGQSRICVGQSLGYYIKLCVAAFADAERRDTPGMFYDPKFTLLHDCSLAHPAGTA